MFSRLPRLSHLPLVYRHLTGSAALGAGSTVGRTAWCFNAAICWLGFAWAIPATGAEPLVLDRLYPAAVSTGTRSTIAAEGKFPEWPVEIWSDRADVKLSCGAEAGQIVVDVPAHTPPGLAWVRLIQADGASSLRPLLIEAAPVAVEQEPNNTLGQATAISLPTTLFGKLDKSEDLDGVRVALPSESTLVATVVGNRLLQSDMDAVLQITDLKGHVLAQSDDEWGIDPQLIFTTEKSTEVIVRVFAFPETPNSTIGFAGAASYAYALRLSTGPVVDHFLPLVASASAPVPRAFGWNLTAAAAADAAWAPATQASPRSAFVLGALGWQWLPVLELDATLVVDDSPLETAASLPSIFSGHIETPGEVDVFRFRAIAGKKIRARVHSRQFGFPLDSVLRIVDATTRRELIRNDDASSGAYDASLDVTSESDADLELHVSDLTGSGGTRHAYSVEVSEVVPWVRATAAQDVIALKAGEEKEFPIAIERLDGFDRQLAVLAVDLPAGITASAAVSEATGESSKSVVLKLKADSTAAATHQHFQIELVESEAAEGQPPRVWKARFELRPQAFLEQLLMVVHP